MLALLGAHHILHVSRVRVKLRVNPICHLLALLGAHHILHVSRVRVNTFMNHSVLPTSWVDEICPVYSVRTAVCLSNCERQRSLLALGSRLYGPDAPRPHRGTPLPCQISILPTERRAVLHDTGVGTQQPEAGKWDARWRSWLRHFAASRKVAGSIPDGVTTNYQ